MKRIGTIVVYAWLTGTAAQAQDTGIIINEVLKTNLTFGLVRGAFEQMLSQQAATFPFGSSSGGFNWVVDPVRGVGQPRRNLGPVFAERASTVGAGRFSLGVQFQRVAFSSIAGQPLDGFDIVVSPRRTVVLRTVMSLDVDVQRTIFTAWYGVTDRIDVGIAIPIGRSTVAGTSTTTVECSAPDGFFCPSGGSRVAEMVSRSGSSSGIGDVDVRSKVGLVSRRSDAAAGDRPVFELAAGVDLHVATGDPDKLLGRHGSQLAAVLFGGSTFRGVSPHFNVGYTFGGQGVTCDATDPVRCVTRRAGLGSRDAEFVQDPSPGLNYAFGAEASVGRVTISGDIVGRVLERAATFEYFALETGSVTSRAFDATRRHVDVVLAGVGLKARVGRSSLVNFGVLVPLNDTGIKPDPSPTVSFEHVF